MDTPKVDAVVRQAVRALVVSEAEKELLLIRLFVPDTGKHIWLTPGGGIEAGELPVIALQREVWEETGQKISSPVGPVWRRHHEFVFRGERFEQHEDYYLVRTPKFEPTGHNNPAQHEAELMTEYRWWPLADIAASEEIFVPRKLAAQLRALLNGPVPSSPIEVGV
ncbi:MAG: 8-oxo-dGTP diphosphatase [Limisphaerales bacterium]